MQNSWSYVSWSWLALYIFVMLVTERLLPRVVRGLI